MMVFPGWAYEVMIEVQGEAVSRIELVAAPSSGNRAKESEGGGSLARTLERDLARYFSGEQVSFLNYPVELSGLPVFSRQVLEAARRIPYGERCSYGELARAVGRPGAARAVGQVLHRNPLPIIVPCHRVVGADGGLRGFAGGVELKRRLLELEHSGCAGGGE